MMMMMADTSIYGSSVNEVTNEEQEKRGIRSHDGPFSMVALGSSDLVDGVKVL
jgi:hypothetical protein